MNKYLLSVFSFLLSFHISMLFAESVSLEKGCVVLDFSTKKWNNTKFVTLLSDSEKTPDGQPSFGFEVRPSENAVFMNGQDDPVFLKELQKLNLPWDSISFWLKSDGGGESFTLVFFCDENRLFTMPVKLLQKGWQKVTVRSLWSKYPSEGPLRFDRIRTININGKVDKPVQFRMGPLEFHLKGSVGLRKVRTLDIAPAAASPVIDGKADDAVWKSSAEVKSWSGNLSRPVSVRLAYDRDNLYVFFSVECKTDELVRKQNRDGEVWEDDSLQLLVSPGNDNRTYHQFVVNSANVGQTYHFYFNQVADTFVREKNLFQESDWESRTKLSPNLWQAEWKIPRRLLGGLDEKQIHGLQIFVSLGSLKEKGFFQEAVRAIAPADFGVMRLAADAGTLPVDIPEPLLVFNRDKGIIAAPGSFVWYLSSPDGRTFSGTGSHVAEIGSYAGSSGVQRIAVLSADGRYFYAARTDTVSFAPKRPWGERLLCPAPKERKTGKGVFPVSGVLKIAVNPKKSSPEAAELLKKDLLGFMQTDSAVVSGPDLPEFTIVIGKTEIPAAPMRPEGYSLNIAPDGIALRGHDPAGLVHAVRTLAQLQKYAFLHNESSLPCTMIQDGPDLPVRIVHRWIDGSYFQWKFADKGKYAATADTDGEIIQGMYDFLDRFAGDSKLNMVLMQNPDQIRYEDPRNQRFNHAMSMVGVAEVRKMAEHCRKNHIEYVPAMSGASHADYMLTRVDKQALALPGYLHWDADPTHPNFFPYLFALYDELIGASSARYFCTLEDEWWHKPLRPVTTHQNGRLRRDIFYDTIVKEHDYLKSKGARMIMFSDMLQRAHNGGKPFDNSLNAEKLPRDIVLAGWSGGEDAIRHFDRLGYQSQWGIFNYTAMGMLDPSKLKDVRSFQGLGTILSGSHGMDASYGIPSLIASAECAWNFFHGRQTPLDDWLMENGLNVMALYSVRPNPAASRKFVPVDLGKIFNDDAKILRLQNLPSGETAMGGIPTRLFPSRAVRGDVRPTVIPIGAKAASLIFLHTQYCAPEDLPKLRLGHRITGWVNGRKTGVYLICYSDGKKIPVYSRNTINNGNVYPVRGFIASEIGMRYVPDARFVRDDNDGKDGLLYQYEWVNPRPEVPIERIEFTSMGDLVPVTPYLLALTLREPRDGYSKQSPP